MKTFKLLSAGFIALCFFQHLHAQNVTWLRQQGNDPELGINNCSATDAAGNIYVTGTTPDPAYFDDVTVDIGQPDNNVFVAKYSPAGDIIWAKSYGSHDNDVAYDIVADAAGNTYIAGHFNENITFGPYTLLDYDERDAFVVKSDPDGNIVWARSITNDGPMHAFAISLFDTTLYITGDLSGTATVDGHTFPCGYVDPYLLKLNTNGNFIWGKYFSSSGNSFGFDLKNDAVGNIIISGYFPNDIIEFEGIELTGIGISNIFVAKLDPDGNGLWANSIECNADDKSEAMAVAINDDGDVYATGYFSGSLFFDTLELTAAGNDIFVVKYDSEGNLLWLKNAGGAENDNGYAIEKNAVGGVYVAGTCSELADAYFDSITIPARDTKFMFVANYLPDGTIKTVKTYDDITPNHLLLVNDSTLNLSAHLDTAITATLYDTVSLAYSDRTGLLMQFDDDNYLCYQPDGLYSDAISDITATIHWDAVSNADAYRVYYFPLPGDTLSVITSSTDVMLTDLTPETNYAYYVRSLCAFAAGDTINGENSDLYTFSTTPVAIHDVAEMEINIYPNPSNGNFTISLPQTETAAVKIYDVSGKLLMDIPEYASGDVINTSGLANGMYVLKLMEGEYTAERNICIMK